MMVPWTVSHEYGSSFLRCSLEVAYCGSMETTSTTRVTGAACLDAEVDLVDGERVFSMSDTAVLACRNMVNPVALSTHEASELG